MDYGMLPPEFNSARMYSGPGAGSLVAAAAVWDGLAAELHATASASRATISELTAAGWQGPSSVSMTAAVQPYLAWVHSTAGQAEQAATQLRAAVVSYEAAFAATVPPAVVLANRSLLMTLIATNVLGQNTAAIAATEAHYGQMWAQDAAAMYGYAATSATATALTPFIPPPGTGHPVQAAAQPAGAVGAGRSAVTAATSTQLPQLATLVPTALQNLATTVTSAPSSVGSGTALSGVSSVLSGLTGAFSPIGLGSVAGVWWSMALQIFGTAQNFPGVAGMLSGQAPVGGALGPLAGGYISSTMPPVGAVGAPGPVSAAMGDAKMVRALSVPTSWASANPTIRNLAAATAVSNLSAATTAAVGAESGMFGNMALASMAGAAMGGGATRRVAGTTGLGGSAANPVAATTATIIVIPAEMET